MSQLTHPRPHILDLSFKPRTWLAALAAVVVIAIPAALVVAPGDDSATNDQATAGSVRYDGGPNEGTRGLSSQSTGQSVGSVRYDGGPDEGTRALSYQSAGQSVGSDTFGRRP